MAQRQRRRSRDISLAIHTFSLTAAPSGSYGLKLTGKSPAMVAQVQSGSVAGKAGLMVGDFVLKVSGRDIRSAEAEEVLRILREGVGRAVEVGVARPYPVPVTDKEKMRALIVLQTKLDSGTIFQSAAPTYSAAVQDALSATQDILGDLGLDLDVNQAIPNSVGQGLVQEVELQIYDSDSLPSPPPSSESEGEKDPLLDFSREDDLTYYGGQPAQGAQSLADSVRQATQALESIQSLTASLQKKDKRPKKSPVLVSSEASFMPSGGNARNQSSNRRQNKSPPGVDRGWSKSPPGVDRGWSKSPPGVDRGRSKSPPGVDRGRSKSPPGVDRGWSKSPTVLDVPAEELQWTEPTAAPTSAVEQTLYSEPPPPVPPHASQPSTHEAPPVPTHGRKRDESLSKQDERRGRPEEKVRETTGGLVVRRQAPKAPRGGQVDHVIMRKRPGKDLPAGIEDDGKVVGMPASYKPLRPPPSHPAPTPPSQDPVTDMADQETALRGLPPSITSWGSEEVAGWLFQLSPTLAQHYRPCFTRHDITGQTLMRLNLSKLKSMGIDNIKHCRQMALEIAKLKIYQESLELRELEEENQISFL